MNTGLKVLKLKFCLCELITFSRPVVKKSKPKFLPAYMNLLIISDNPFSSTLQRPYSGFVDPKNGYRKPPAIIKAASKVGYSMNGYWRKLTNGREVKTESTNGREEELKQKCCCCFQSNIHLKFVINFKEESRYVIHLFFSLNKPFAHIQSVLLLEAFEKNIHLTTQSLSIERTIAACPVPPFDSLWSMKFCFMGSI